MKTTTKTKKAWTTSNGGDNISAEQMVNSIHEISETGLAITNKSENGGATIWKFEKKASYLSFVSVGFGYEVVTGKGAWVRLN